jgi:hypothetical protein
MAWYAPQLWLHPPCARRVILPSTIRIYDEQAVTSAAFWLRAANSFEFRRDHWSSPPRNLDLVNAQSQLAFCSNSSKE